MNAEQQRQFEQDTALMDSIALEALSSKPAVPVQPGLELDDTHSVLGSSEAQFAGLNLDDETEADRADTGDERIDDYCDRHRLDVRSRIELFIQVCKAVHVAHQHAIIHGNLMPDFILITSSGVPKLLHFGKANPAAFGSFANDTKDGARSEPRRRSESPCSRPSTPLPSK